MFRWMPVRLDAWVEHVRMQQTFVSRSAAFVGVRTRQPAIGPPKPASPRLRVTPAENRVEHPWLTRVWQLVIVLDHYAHQFMAKESPMGLLQKTSSRWTVYLAKSKQTSVTIAIKSIDC